jgi:hypothetical protein
MGEERYPLVGFSEWFDNPRKYAWKPVTIEGTFVDWKYGPDRDPLGLIVAAAFALRVAELRLKLKGEDCEGEVYYRQDTHWLFSDGRARRREKLGEILDPLIGQSLKPVVMCIPAPLGINYLHLQGLNLDEKILMFNEMPNP